MIAGEALKNLASRMLFPLTPEHVGVNSIDLTLGEKIWVQIEHTTPRIVDLSDIPEEEYLYSLRRMSDGGFILKPRQFIKAVIQERIIMPEGVAGMFSLRSAIAQAGLEQSTSVWIHSGWKGNLILELCNFTDNGLLLRPGLRIGQIHLFGLQTTPL